MPRATISIDDIENLLARLEHSSDDEVRKELAQQCIDALDKDLSKMDPFSPSYMMSFRRFRSISCRHNCMPSACYISKDDIEMDSEVSVHQTAMSDVYTGQLRGVRVALKSLRLTESDRENVRKAFRKEAATWRSLRHRNIAPFLGISDIHPACLVSRWLENGHIVDFLSQNPNHDRIPCIIQILGGLTYLHALDVVHGDLKSSNILVTPDGQACISDFGTTTVLYAAETFSCTRSAMGTFRWMAPELLHDDTHAAPSKESDMYAFSMVTWELFTGLVPFHQFGNFGAIIEVMKGTRPPKPVNAEHIGFGADIWAMIQQCWDADRVRRLSGHQALQAMVVAQLLRGLYPVALIRNQMNMLTRRQQNASIAAPSPIVSEECSCSAKVMADLQKHWGRGASRRHRK